MSKISATIEQLKQDFIKSLYRSSSSIDNSLILAIDELREELSAVSEVTRNLQAEIAKVKQNQSEGAKESTSPIPASGELSP
jgi:hypothetical protein